MVSLWHEDAFCLGENGTVLGPDAVERMALSFPELGLVVHLDREDRKFRNLRPSPNTDQVQNLAGLYVTVSQKNKQTNKKIKHDCGCQGTSVEVKDNFLDLISPFTRALTGQVSWSGLHGNHV